MPADQRARGAGGPSARGSIPGGIPCGNRAHTPKSSRRWSGYSVLAPQRGTLAALTPVLVGTADEGLFAPGTAFSRRRVQAVFFEAVRGASDAPAPDDAAALSRLLYLVHLAVILWWLFDKTPRQRATRGLLALLEGALPMAALALRLEPARNFVRTADILCREGLFGDDDDPASAEAQKEEA